MFRNIGSVLNLLTAWGKLIGLQKSTMMHQILSLPDVQFQGHIYVYLTQALINNHGPSSVQTSAETLH